VVPDLVCLGKALTGGFPLSACVGRADIMDAWPVSRGEALHTSTYLGNPLGCAMALAALKLHADPGVARQVRELGAEFKKALQGISSPRIGDVRGVGLMLAVELVKAKGEPDGEGAVALMLRALQSGILMLPEGPDANVLSILPPFGISREEVAWFCEWLGRELLMPA
jgi:4-aminobutyrate aminotransferase-like enzyme